MLELGKDLLSDVKIIPRGFSRSILIDEETFEAVRKAQSLLNSDIKLVVTRAYQPEKIVLKLARFIGAKVFGFIYPARKNEIQEIFGHNGHAIDGRHIDISIEYKKQIINLLPANVFTTPNAIQNIQENYSEIITNVWDALQQAGFSIHNNKVEALQIHCDFITTK